MASCGNKTKNQAMEYIIIIAVIVIILAILFLRKRDEQPSDYVPPTYKASGRQWVFNGILDIDSPPSDLRPFTDYEGEIQLMVKKGFLHYDLVIEDPEQVKDKVGLFRAIACLEGGRIVIRHDTTVLGYLPSGLTVLEEHVRNTHQTEAYGFIARHHDAFFGEVCVRK